MSKRILSLLVILAVFIVSLPIIPLGVVAEETTVKNMSSSILTVDRVINDFENTPTTGTVTVGENTVNVGIGTNDNNYTVNDYSASGTANNNLTIENGVLKNTLVADSKFIFHTTLSPVSMTRGNTMPSIDSIALQFHVDFTGITSVNAGNKVEFEIEFCRSKGNSGYNVYYCIPDETFLYIPDATADNPNPETQILTTGGGVQVDHGCVWGYAGQSGTVVVPLDVWDSEKKDQGSDIWELYKATQTWQNRSYIAFETYTHKYKAGDVFIMDDLCWMKKNTKTYDYEVTAQDFSKITNSNLSHSYGGGAKGPATWKRGTNYSITDEKLKIVKTCDRTGSGWAMVNFPIKQWSSDYEALAFDFDISEMVNSTTFPTGNTTYIWMYYYVAATATTAEVKDYIDGTSKFIWEDGTTTNFEFYASGGNYLPRGFKGTVVIPASAITLSEAALAAIEAGGELKLCIRIGNFTAEQQNKPMYLDNFRYYYNAEGLGDTAGTDFSKLDNPQYETVKPVTEDIRTVEAFFKTDTKLTQGILGTKFGDANYHGISAEITMVATGQLVLTIGNARMTIGNMSLNDGNWHHVALTADDTNSKLSCYVDGQLVKEVALSELTFNKSTDYLPITIGSNMPAESKFFTVFEGTIANVRLWNDVRTAEEIAANKTESVGADADGLIAEWMLDSANLTAETTGNYNLKPFYWNIDTENALFAQYNRDAAEDDFTIVFLPDTQTIIKNFESQVPEIFDWIIANAERLKIKAVVSLGDIIEYKAVEAGYSTMAEQYARLTAAGIPSVCTIGDHDYYDLGTRDTRYYDKYFTPDLLVQNDEFSLGGLYEEGSLLNGYYYLNIEGGAKFLIMNLEVHARDIILDWANDVIAANPDCHVIVATHNYMSRPYCGRFITTGYENYPLHMGNAGEAVWQKFLSQHKNIDMLLCGHAESSGYWYNTDTGIHGNEVIQINCDLQNTDQSYKTAATVLMGRFKNDGSEVSFNLYSVHNNLFIDSNSNDRVHKLNGIIEKSVASVDGVKYADLGEALNNADGGTVTLLADVNIDQQIIVTGNAALDLHGFDLNLANAENYAINVKGELTVTGEGNINVTGYGLATGYNSNGIIKIESGVFNADSCDYIIGCFGGEVIINGGDFNGEYCVVNNFCEYYGIVGKVTVNGGKFSAEYPLLGGENEVTVTSGTFNIDVAEYLAETSGIKLIDGIYTADSDEIIADTDENGNVSATDLVYLRNKIMGDIVDDKYFDINGDGAFNALDIVRTKKISVR